MKAKGGREERERREEGRTPPIPEGELVQRADDGVGVEVFLVLRALLSVVCISTWNSGGGRADDRCSDE